MKRRKKLTLNIASVIALLLFTAMIIAIAVGAENTDKATKAQQLEIVKSSVEKSITLCYSIEGEYPESFEYLMENYGVNYDKEQYMVHYSCFGANVRPSVTVIERKK